MLWQPSLCFVFLQIWPSYIYFWILWYLSFWTGLWHSGEGASKLCGVSEFPFKGWIITLLYWLKDIWVASASCSCEQCFHEYDVQISRWHPSLNSCEYIPRSVIADYNVEFCLFKLLGNSIVFSIMIVFLTDLIPETLSPWYKVNF